MGAIISSLIRTVVDQGGRPLTEAWLLWEFRGQGTDNQYQPGGEIVDLTTIFRQVEWAQAAMASGINIGLTPVVGEDYPGNPGSGRMKLFYATSGVVNTSGRTIRVHSGQPFTISGVLGILSGLIEQQSFLVAGLTLLECLSGTNTSGTRARVYAVGY